MTRLRNILMHGEVSRSVLAAIVIVGAIIVSLSSPLSQSYALPGWGAVALGAALSLLFGSRDWFQRSDRARHLFSRTTTIRKGLDLLDLAILSQVAAATVQALVAINLPSPFLPLHNTPAIGLVYLLLAGSVAFVATSLALSAGERGRCWAALLGAGLFGSTLYLRTFTVPEAGPIYGSIFALTLLAASAFYASNHPHRQLSWQTSAFTVWSLLFLTAVALAVLFSPVPGQGLQAWLRLAVLIGLAAMLSGCIDTQRTWRIVAWGMVTMAGVLPILLAVGKLFSLTIPFGLPAALSYRWHPTELGGANLIARAVLCVVPLALALINSLPLSPRVRRGLSVGTLAGSAFAMIYSRSWEGFFAWLVALGVYTLLTYRPKIRAIGQRWSGSRVIRWGFSAGITLLLLSFVIFSTRLAPLLNIYSFNGRLIHWYGATLAWLDHPWLGGGPANEIIYTPYAGQVNLFVETQIISDDPLYAIRLDAGKSLKVHSHNIFLEIGSTTGVVGLIGFIGLLVTLYRAGFRAIAGSNRQRANFVPACWAAACLAGIAGELAWGMLDVLWVTPPFFSFPIWGLIGLLLASNQKQTTNTVQRVPGDEDGLIAPLRTWPLAILALLIVLLPALASTSYAAGFLAWQERHWTDAITSLERAAYFAPLDAHVRELLARAYLEQGAMTEAAATYQDATVLKQGYSPHYSQLGWLAWLQGDIDQATDYFQQAIVQDPGEVWRDGLHADLGLAYAAQGRLGEAIALFKQTIKLNPKLAMATYWQPVEQPDGRFDVVLDPIYLHGPSLELNKRIWAHLGISDMTSRLFAYEQLTESPVSFNEVLDAIEADYRLARTNHNRQAPLLLAALTETSRLAGFNHRAEQGYLTFQAFQPNSAYGFRDLGMLYRQQDRLSEAQVALERAVEVSPGDNASWHNLALVYLDQEKWSNAAHAIDVITRQSMLTLFHSHLFNPDLYVTQARLYQAQGNLPQAIDALNQVSLIRAEPADYLAMANLYDRLDQPRQAAPQCIRAASALQRNWPRPRDPTLWEIGQCLAKAGDQGLEMATLVGFSPLINLVLQGHIYRAQGQSEKALVAYQQAAETRLDEGAVAYFLGETYQALGQPDSAFAAYRQAVQLDPLETLPYLALGRLQSEQGQTEAALASFRTAVVTTPGWGEAQIALGNALLVLPDQAEATIHFQQAQRLDGGITEGRLFDFGGQLALATLMAPGPEYIHNDYFTLNGERRRTIFQHPRSRLSYHLTVPAASAGHPVSLLDGWPVSPQTGPKLVFAMATKPESWQSPGDGVTFAVYIESEQGIAQIFSHDIDPKHHETDRHWLPAMIDLSLYAGQSITLTLETDSGPVGDNRFDWAGWGEPRLIQTRADHSQAVPFPPTRYSNKSVVDSQ